MTAHERDIRRLCREAELRILSIRQTKHLKVEAATRNGTTVTLTFPVSPSDHRWQRNQAHQIARQVEASA